MSDEKKPSAYMQSRAKGFLQRRVGRAFLSAFGSLCDTFVDLTGAAIESGLARFAPYDALPLIAAERRMIRSPTETEDQWRLQLQRSRYWHSLCGTDRGHIEGLARAGLTANVWRNRQLTNIAGFDNDALWARLWIVIQKPNPFTAPYQWGGGRKWGDGARWSAEGASRELIDFIKAIVNQNLASHCALQGIFVVVDENGAGPLTTSWNGTRTDGGRKIIKLVL